MKTAREYIRQIEINDANIDYILNHPERKINGSLLLDMECIMNKYAQQQAIEFAKWDFSINELIDSNGEPYSMEELYQKFKEEQK